jgi:hypothetical protein
MTDGILKRGEALLKQCGTCDLGLPYACNCPTGDFRPVMSELVREVERLRKALDDVRDLHTDSPAGVCPPCFRSDEVSDTDDGLVAWPCPTLRAMGVEEVRFG